MRLSGVRLRGPGILPFGAPPGGAHAALRRLLLALRWWPQQMCSSIQRLCRHQQHAREAIHQLHARFLRNQAPLLWPVDPFATRAKVTPVEKPSVLWFPLPYHPDAGPAFRRALTRTLAEHAHLFRHLFQDAASGIQASDIRIAWANPVPALLYTVRSHREE